MQYLFCFCRGGGNNCFSPLTEVEKQKLKSRPSNWRLACQTLVKTSAVVLTKPQSPPTNLNELVEASNSKKLSR